MAFNFQSGAVTTPTKFDFNKGAVVTPADPRSGLSSYYASKPQTGKGFLHNNQTLTDFYNRPENLATHQGVKDLIAGTDPRLQGQPSTSVGSNFTSDAGKLTGFSRDSFAPIPNPVDIPIGIAKSQEFVTKGLATGVRNIQAVPDIFKAAVGGFQENGQLNDPESLLKANETMAKPILGQKTLSGSTPMENVGSALNAAADVVAVKGTVPKIFGNGVTKAAVSGAEFGALGGEGQYLTSQEKPTLIGALGAAGKGTLTGAVTAGLANKIAPVMTGQQSLSDFVKQNFTVNGIKQQLQQPLIDKLNKSLKDAFDYGKKGAESTTNEQSAQMLAKKGYIPDMKKVGNRYQMDTVGTQEEILNNEIDPLNKTLNDYYKIKDTYTNQKFNLDDIANQAKVNAAKSTIVRGAGNLPAVKAQIDATVANLKATYGDEVNFTQLNQIKQGQWSQVGTFDPTSPKYMGDVNRSIGQAARKTLETNTSELEIGKINQEVGRWYDTIDDLSRVNGRIAPGGKLGNYVNQVIGSVVGSHFGPLGTLSGAKAGAYLNELMQSNTLTNPIKRSILESIPKDSDLYNTAQATLRAYEQAEQFRIQNTPQLNAPEAIRLPDKYTNPDMTAKDFPSQMTEAQKVLQRNPKTGRIQKVYTSESVMDKITKNQPGFFKPFEDITSTVNPAWTPEMIKKVQGLHTFQGGPIPDFSQPPPGWYERWLSTVEESKWNPKPKASDLINSSKKLNYGRNNYDSSNYTGNVGGVFPRKIPPEDILPQNPTIGPVYSNPGNNLRPFTKNGLNDVLPPSLKPPIPKAGSVEQIIEAKSGWRPGDRALFDNALSSGDAATVKAMLPRIPESYKLTFAKKIGDLLNLK